jgi:hypothetical protein
MFGHGFWGLVKSVQTGPDLHTRPQRYKNVKKIAKKLLRSYSSDLAICMRGVENRIYRSEIISSWQDYICSVDKYESLYYEFFPPPYMEALNSLIMAAGTFLQITIPQNVHLLGSTDLGS